MNKNKKNTKPKNIIIPNLKLKYDQNNYIKIISKIHHN